MDPFKNAWVVRGVQDIYSPRKEKEEEEERGKSFAFKICKKPKRENMLSVEAGRITRFGAPEEEKSSLETTNKENKQSEKD